MSTFSIHDLVQKELVGKILIRSEYHPKVYYNQKISNVTIEVDESGEDAKLLIELYDGTRVQTYMNEDITISNEKV